MTSVVSTVAGGLETPDFLELRKNSTRAASEMEPSGPRSLYHVVPEKQTSVRGLMGSERGYDVSAVAGAPIPVLGDERGTKVGFCLLLVSFPFPLLAHFNQNSGKQMEWTYRLMLGSWRVYQLMSCSGDTPSIRRGMPVSAGRGRTCPISWPKEWPTWRRKNRRWTIGIGRRERILNSETQDPVTLHCLVYFLLALLLTYVTPSSPK